MPSAVRLREDYSAEEVRRLARRSKDVNQSRRLQILIMQLRTYALEPLGIVVKRFGKAAVGVVARAATEGVMKWLKGIIKSGLDKSSPGLGKHSVLNEVRVARRRRRALAARELSKQ